MKIYNHIKSILEQNEKFCKEGKLFKNVVVEAGLKLDSELLSILLSDETAKKYFFTDVNSVAVFDKVKFQKFVSNKQFLPDSYTAFKNKIGLTANGEYLTEANEVVLDFPYKDCVLEGGQTKENQKRQEIFWNETLAPDEIDRLFEPKVLTNWKRYDKDGEHEVKSISLDDNLIIKGNNLIALHSLKKVYKGKVKLIYIDPPYNTGNDSFQYNDSFNHSTWLTFMKNRLEVAKELLSDDGVIFVQCDDNEQAYLKVLMDEIFKDGFINNIVAEMSNLSGNKIEHAIKGRKFPKIKEYILLYAKNKNSYELTIPKFNKSKWDNEYNIIFPELNKSLFATIKVLINEGDEIQLNKILENLKLKSLKDYLKKNNIKETNEWKLENSHRIVASKPNTALRKKALLLDLKQEVFALKNQRGDLKIIKSNFNKDTDTARIELVFAEDNNKVFYGDIWHNITTTGGVAQEGGVVLKNGKKPEDLINRVLKSTLIKNEFVLDFHLGSGTTAAVAHKMGLRYIGIEQIQNQIDMSLKRLNNVINGDTTGISKDVNWQGGGSFIYTELAKDNAEILDNIQNAKDSKDLIAIWEEIKDKPFLSYKVNPEDIDKNITDFKDLSFDNQKKLLVSLLDENQLYVNLSEIESTDHNISKEDEAINQKFYSL